MAHHRATSPANCNGLPTLSRVDTCDFHRQRCCTFHGRCTRPSATVPFLLPLWESGTCYHVIAVTADSADFQAWIDDGTVSQIVRQCTLAATAALTLAWYVTFTAALKFCLRLVSPWSSWMMMMMMILPDWWYVSLCVRPVSRGAYYLAGDLALMEHRLMVFASKLLRSSGFRQFSCPDTVKSNILVSVNLYTRLIHRHCLRLLLLLS